ATALSTAQWTSTRAGYLDKLNVSGALAHSDAADTYKADVSGIANTLGSPAGGSIAADIAAVKSQTGDIETSLGDVPTNAELAQAIITGLTTALTEGYRATGQTGSVRDLLYEILAHLGEFAISGTTKTTKKLDGSTTAKTYTLDDADSPTSITEAS